MVDGCELCIADVDGSLLAFVQCYPTPCAMSIQLLTQSVSFVL